MKFTFNSEIFAPIPLPPMDEQPNRSLQFFFVQFIIVQQFAQQLNIIEENLIDVSDFFEDEGIHQTTPLINHMPYAC